MTNDDTFKLGYRPALDGLRGFALVLVLWTHAVGVLLHRKISVGHGGLVGLDIFFVLSGFLITSLLIERRQRAGHVDYRDFYTRRARRLLPALYVFLAVNLIVAVFAQRDLGSELRGVLASLTYSYNWALVAGADLAESQRHLWSLAVEEQYYLVWPLVVPLVLRLKRPLLWLSVAVAAVAAWRVVLSADRVFIELYGVYVRTDARADELLIGSMLAIGMHRGWRFSRPVAAALGAVGTAIVLYFFWVTYVVHPWLYRGGFTLVAVGAAGMVVVCLDRTSWLGRMLAHPVFVWLGKRSYSTYLFHLLAYELAASIFPNAFGPRVVLAIGAAFTCSALCFRFVERPFLELGHRRPDRDAVPRRPRWAVATTYAGVAALTLAVGGSAAALVARERSGGVIGGETVAAGVIAPPEDVAGAAPPADGSTPTTASTAPADGTTEPGSTDAPPTTAAPGPGPEPTTVVDAGERLASVLVVLPPGVAEPTVNLNVTVPMAAVLQDASGVPLAGRTVVLTLEQSAAAVGSCRGATDISGRMSCAVTVPGDVTTTTSAPDVRVVGRFDGDDGYLPAEASWP